MLLQTSGYQIYGERLTRVSKMFETNQLQVEHRYFAGSTPEVKDWSKLTVRQSAEDFHHIVQVFKNLYTAKWVNSGASKGGMTSIFHRRFYPKDVDGTIADVTPISFALYDLRFLPFIETVGGLKYASCRKNLENIQKLLLEQRESILPTITGDFTLIGSKEIAYDIVITELPFAFWQYMDPEDTKYGCNFVSNAQSSTDSLNSFLGIVNAVESYSNEGTLKFQPYYVQSAYELGYPVDKTQHIEKLLKHQPSLQMLLPEGVSLPYSNKAMLDIQAWVKNEAEKMLFTYGEFDPWTAGMFDPIRENADNHRYIVANGNHTSSFMNLPDALRNEFIQILSMWFNKSPKLDMNKFIQEEQYLEDVEINMRRKLKL